MSNRTIASIAEWMEDVNGMNPDATNTIEWMYLNKAMQLFESILAD